MTNKKIVEVKPEWPLARQEHVGHNRWHPEIDPVLTVSPGDVFTLQTIDASDAAVTADQPDAPWPAGRVHPMTGPVFVEGAGPGDVLEVEIISTSAGRTGVSSVDAGKGLLGDLLTENHAFAWTIADGFARASELPGVAIPAAIFPGVIGVAPSPEYMATAHKREQELAAAGATVAAHQPEDAVPSWTSAGLRSLPPRENGGNMDVRQLTRGSRLLIRIQVPGALLSVGDMHFSQGDGELGGSAIEIAGSVTMSCHLHRSPAWAPAMPFILPAPEPTRPRLMATGMATEEAGPVDVIAAARAAARQLVDWLVSTRGLTPAQAYIVLSVTADLRIAQLVNDPYPTVTASVPLDIFTDVAIPRTGADIVGPCHA